MKVFSIKIKFTTDYLQARFTEDAKKEIENYISQGIIKSEEDSWKVLLHEDAKGVYIPAIQLRNCLINSGKEFKVKKQRRSMQAWVISNIIVEPEHIYFGKPKPDKILVSYPARKDGNRVTIKHPAFLAGTEVEFIVKSLDDGMETKAIENLIIMAGKMYGIGARRRDLYGRFELVNIKAKL
mgnify:CR=1 FL=1